MAVRSRRPEENSHVTADVISDARAMLRPPEVGRPPVDVRRLEALECDKANARARRLQNRLRRCRRLAVLLRDFFMKLNYRNRSVLRGFR